MRGLEFIILNNIERNCNFIQILVKAKKQSVTGSAEPRDSLTKCPQPEVGTKSTKQASALSTNLAL